MGHSGNWRALENISMPIYTLNALSEKSWKTIATTYSSTIWVEVNHAYITYSSPWTTFAALSLEEKSVKISIISNKGSFATTLRKIKENSCANCSNGSAQNIMQTELPKNY